MRAFILMMRMEDEIDILCRRPLWAMTKSAFGLHVALQLEPTIALETSDIVFDQIKALIDARVSVLVRRQRQLDARYEVKKLIPQSPKTTWIDLVRAMARPESSP